MSHLKSFPRKASVFHNERTRHLSHISHCTSAVIRCFRVGNAQPTLVGSEAAVADEKSEGGLYKPGWDLAVFPPAGGPARGRGAEVGRKRETEGEGGTRMRKGREDEGEGLGRVGRFRAPEASPLVKI